MPSQRWQNVDSTILTTGTIAIASRGSYTGQTSPIPVIEPIPVKALSVQKTATCKIKYNQNLPLFTAPTHTDMARLSWPGWMVYLQKGCYPDCY